MAEPSATVCFHCGEALPAAPLLALTAAEGEQWFCCRGCQAAAEFIRDHGFGDYYRLRNSRGARVQQAALGHWDRRDVLDLHGLTLDQGLREISLISDDMHCAACAWLIDRVLRREPGVTEVSANAITGRIRLRWRQTTQPLSQLLARLAGLGYRVSLAPDPAREAATLKARRMLIMRLGVAALGAMQAMMLAEALYLDFDRSMDLATRDFFRWVTWLISTPVVFFSGWPFLHGAWRELRLARLGMDTLVSGAVLLAWLASTIETVRGGPHVWFDAAVMFVFFLLAARSLERLARQRANALVERLAQAQPALATRLTSNGETETVPVSALHIGDQVQVAAGDTLPADGRLLHAAALNEALLSGESLPMQRVAGETALAGSVALECPVQIEVTRIGSQTRIAELLRAVERAQAGKPRLAQWADRVAHYFVLALMMAALITAGLWWQIDPERALEVTLAVLVISCPCALSLAVPTALVSAHAALARHGLLAIGADALERLADVDQVLIDKTGTLTQGRPQLQSVQCLDKYSEREVLAIAASLEQAAHHPLAKAFAGLGGSIESAVRELRLQVGRGVEGEIDGDRYRLGRADFSVAAQADDGALWLGDAEGRPLARFEIDDPLRHEAADAMQALQQQGLQVRIVSGDSQGRVALIAEQLGLSHWQGRMSPEDKLRYLQNLQAQGRRVWMIGDGINDAPVLAQANVSLAMGEGAPIAHRCADFVLQHARLDRLPQALAIARKTRRAMRQNLGWAVAYNLISLPFAMAGWIEPWLAALGMTLSSLAVTLNALRLAGPRPTASLYARVDGATDPIGQDIAMRHRSAAAAQP